MFAAGLPAWPGADQIDGTLKKSLKMLSNGLAAGLLFNTTRVMVFKFFMTTPDQNVSRADFLRHYVRKGSSGVTYGQDLSLLKCSHAGNGSQQYIMPHYP